jgi:hypothetical protein
MLYDYSYLYPYIIEDRKVKIIKRKFISINIKMTSTTFFIIFIPILGILLLSINLLLPRHNPYQEKDSVRPHIFLTVPYQLPKTSYILKSEVSFTDNGKSNGDITFYIPLYEGDNLIFVPVVSVDTMAFESDLTKPIHKCNPIPNNEKDSQKAIEKAISIFKQSELCVCDLKQIS